VVGPLIRALDDRATGLARATPRLPREASLPRKRLLELLPPVWDCRLCLVAAPAGSGKTTLLAQFATAADVPVAYCAAEPGDDEPGRFLGRVASALAKSVPGISADWPDAEGGASILEEELPSRTLLLVDDFHVLHRTPAEASFERLLAYAPARLGTFVASRSRPGFNWSRLVVTGTLSEIGGDDLRFRSWEVEQLFCQLYGEPLPPEDLADLTRRTEGWAAGLRLFYLATRGRPASERRRMLSSLRVHWGLAREYLAQNVLDGLDEELRRFLVDTCVLPRLSGPLCHELLGRTGSGRLLHELEARQLFTYDLGDGCFRYHETLRSYLEDVLAEQLGEPGARARFARAGEILETAGFPSDALVAYSRAEAWPAVARLLGRDGERIIGRPVALDALPRVVVDNDPWLLLASARRHMAVGRFDAALALYRDAERHAKGTAAAEISRRERSALSLWLEPNPPPTADALGLLRAATNEHPREVRLRAVALGTPEGTLVAGLAALLAGECADAASLLRVARDTLEPGSAAAAAAHVAFSVALLLTGDPTGAAEARVAAEVAESGGFAWLGRVALAASTLAVDPVGAREGPILAVVDPEHGGWPSWVAVFLEALGALRRGDGPVPFLGEAATRFRELGAGVLETWARAALALARARTGDPRAAAAAREAERLARLRGVPGGQALAFIALAELDDDQASEHWDSVRALQAACSLALTASPPGVVARRPGRGRLAIRCFGAFELVLDGKQLDLASVKPRARSLLAMLVVRAGAPVHRELLMEALWPGSSPVSAAGNLHVVVSTLRRALQPGRARGDASLIRREGEAYRLAIPEDSFVDLVSFESALAEARTARGARDLDRAVAACERALDLYRGELLPAEGPADWLLPDRERRAAEACEAAAVAAEALLERAETPRAVALCERGLAVDRYDGVLWRLWADAQERAGDVGGALRTRRRYERLLLELTGEARAG
jgi:DNA-binding SARP family transcriptional activator